MTVANVQITKVLLKRGNTIQNNSYRGVYGELSIDMEANALRIHDGVVAGGNVVSGSGGSGSYANSNVKSYLTSFDGNILPSANVTYSLGSSTRQWKDLWVSNNTIYINSIPLSINNNGNLTVNGSEISRGPQGNVGATGATGAQGPRGNIGPQGPQGNVGPVGSTGATGSQGIQGNVGATGPQGIQGNTGPTGAQGIQGIQGNVGPQGSTGAQGIQGNTGPAGAQGAQGIQGNVGETGPRGFTGNTGEQGPQGERGLTGNTGAQGTSVTLLGSVDFVANLPITANVGEGWIVQADGDLYLWNTISSDWNNIGQIVGPQGDPGPEGPRGFTGNVGATGAQGETGPAGPQGEQGIQGNVGAQGERGIQGNIGLQGNIGPQGEQGIQGNIGPQGERGIQGNVGPQGATGATGAQGAQGNAGVNGTNGEDGVGISNATITSGNLVITLTDATQIDAGNVVGPQGPQGDQGPAGDPGGNANTGDITFDANEIGVSGNNGEIKIRSADGADYSYTWQTPQRWEAYVENDSVGDEGAWAWIKADMEGGVNNPEVFIENVPADTGVAQRWTFDAAGNLTLPEGGDILNSNGASVLTSLGNLEIDGSMIITDGSTDVDSYIALTAYSGPDVENPDIMAIGTNNGKDVYITTDSGQTNFKFNSNTGLTFPDNTVQTTAYTGGGNPLTISEIASGNVANVVGNVTAIRFDSDTGFNVEDLGSGEVKVSLGSSFKTWLVDGEDSLVAQGEDTVEFIAGTGVVITTNNTAPKSITISADSLVNLDGGSAGTVYDTPVVYADGGGASTRFGVNSVVFDGESTAPNTIDYNLNGGRA